MSRAKILIMVDWFTPGYKAGGPIQSCFNVAYALKDLYEIYVFTSDCDLGSETPYEGIESDKWIQNLHPSINVYYASKKNLSPLYIKKVIAGLAPDFIYLNHLFSPLFVVYPLWLNWRGKIRSKVVVCPRGALYDSALAIRKYKKDPFLKIFKWMRIHNTIRFHATNEREKNAILKFFPGSEIVIADNLPNNRQDEFSSVSKTEGKLICIFVSRIHPIKNLHFLLNLLKDVKSEIKLSIIGPIEDANYWQECKSNIEHLPPNIEVTYLGSVPNNQLSKLIQHHHLFILPTTGENFGHAIFEALLSGRPVLISDQTPWQDLQKAGIGWELSLEDSRSFIKAIETAASWDQDNFNAYAESSWKYARKFNENPTLQKQYTDLFNA
jgi:glycosyltransferase involved in cell wall biosynthesis